MDPVRGLLARSTRRPARGLLGDLLEGLLDGC